MIIDSKSIIIKNESWYSSSNQQMYVHTYIYIYIYTIYPDWFRIIDIATALDDNKSEREDAEHRNSVLENMAHIL